MVFMALIVIFSTLKNRLAAPVKWIWQPFICQLSVESKTEVSTSAQHQSWNGLLVHKWCTKTSEWVEEESDIPAKSDSAILGQFSPTFPDTASFLLGLGWWLQDTDGQRTGMERGHRERRQRTRMAAPPVTASVKVTARLYRAETIDEATKGRVTNPNSDDGVPF